MENKKMHVLGVMSGSSLDGMDLALCSFKGFGSELEWKIERSTSIAFSEEWKKRLQNLPNSSAREFVQADYDFGYLVGEKCKEFIGTQKVDYIASHGHTIFHHPESKMTSQIGNGAAIAAAAGIPVINDFRSLDIAYGGQGAPIVALFDQYVFGHIDMMANLGGIVNITFNHSKRVFAFDIGPCNQPLNFLAGKRGLNFDKNGNLAARGSIDKELLQKLLNHPYYKMDIPKSLDNSYVHEKFFPILENSKCSLEDKLRTTIELIAVSIENDIRKYHTKTQGSILLAGGGAHNSMLVTVLKSKIQDIKVIVPEKDFIDFKEALMMAFLGYLRVNEIENVLSSVTGASCDSIGGSIYLT